MNLPNKLTMLRIILVPVFILLFLFDFKISAMLIFVIASITDMFDGYIARKYDLITDFGKLMDPIADKLLTTAAFCALVDANLMNIWLLFIVIAREFIVTGVRLIAVAKSNVISAGNMGKLKTVLQIITIVVGLMPIIFPLQLYIYDVLLYLTLVITILSGIEYVWQNKDIAFKH